MNATMRLSSSSTSTTSSRCVARRSRSTVVHVVSAKKDALCKDMVAVKREVQSQGKVYEIAFMAQRAEKRIVKCRDDQYILDAAEEHGLDLPATCRGGICGACVARVSSGTFDQSDIVDLEFTLSPEEQAKGMALLCMTRATSDMTIETQCDWGYSLGVGEWKGASGKFEAEPDPLMGTEWNMKEKVSSKSQ